MSEQRNYAAEMAAYLAEHFMSAAVQQIQEPGETRASVLNALCDAVKRGAPGAFDALVRQLRPILIRLARDLSPDDPQDLISELFFAVKKGDRTLPELRARICQADWSTRRGLAREQRKRGALRLVVSQDSGTTRDTTTGELVPVLLPVDDPLPEMVAEVFDTLTPEEQTLWLGYAEETPVPEIAAELGISTGNVYIRWYRLRTVLEKRFRDLASDL